MTDNPLIADVKSSTEAYSGIPLAESAMDLNKAIQSGDWASIALGAVGTALEAIATVLDPFGAILAAGVGWLMEHVGPLKEALDALAGDPDEIKAHSETWKNIATELGSIGEDMTGMVANDTVTWEGVSGDAYRTRAADTVALLTTAKEASDGASSGIKTAGEVVAAVRALVRDIIAELVGHLISWALQVLFTLGIGLTWVVPQVVTAVAKTASQIATLTKRLVDALKALSPLLKKAGDLFSDAAGALKKIQPGKGSPPPKQKGISDGPEVKDVPRGKPDGEGTGPSSAKPDPVPPPPKTEGKGGGGEGTGPSSAKPDPVPPPPKTNGNAEPPPPKTNNGPPNNPRGNAVGEQTRKTKGDPVDIATGEVVLRQTDLELPAAPEMLLERTHVSSYRTGRWFGPSWSSTLDQRLEIDGEHVSYFSPDGMILTYPLPSGDTPVLPVEGPRWPLSATPDGGYLLEDPIRPRTWLFGAVPGRDEPALLAVTGDDEDQRLDISYDETGAPKQLRHTAGYLAELGTEGGRITAVRVLDPAQGVAVPVVRYGYDERGRLNQVVNSSGKPMVFDYDGHGRLTGWQDRVGSWYRYLYDSNGRCVRTVGDKGFLDSVFGYDRTRLITTHTDSLGHISEFHLNDANQTVREVNPLGQVTEYEWDRYDHLLSRTDPLGRNTRYTYDEIGLLTEVRRPDGSVLRVDDDEEGPLSISVVDGERVWLRVYGDSPGDAPDHTAEQLGVATPFDYERLLEEYEPETARQDRDLFGRPRVVTDPLGGQTRLGWTVEGLKASRVDRTGGQELWRYDGEGNELEYVDAAGHATRNEYGPFGLVFATVDPAGARTSYGYDTELRLTSVTNPSGLSWQYTYDAAGRLVEEKDFDGRVLRFSYDAAGQLVRSVNGAGEVTEYAHDALGNVVECRTPSGVTGYTYDPVGRLVRAVSPEAVLEFERDPAGRVLRETINDRSVLFSYDQAGRLLHRRTPSGVDSSWTYDALGNPETLSTGGHLLRFDHDRAGREIRRTVDELVTLTQSFDAADQLTGQAVTAGPATVQQRRFDYRPDGSLTGISDAVSGPVRFDLDPAGRVVEVAAADHRESYRYDAAGNIVLSSVDGSWPPEAELGGRHYAGNTLLGAGAVGYRYDQQGRLVQRTVGAQIWSYGWDSRDQLVAVSTPDGGQWRYLYDPIGRRIAKLRLGTNGSVVERIDYAWDDATLIEQVHSDAMGNRQVLTWERHPEDDRPIAQAERYGDDTDRRFYSIVTDLVGTPVDLVDPYGSLAWHGRSGLWGKMLPAPPGTASTPLRFPGQYADPETGLHYNVYRYYDPATGRYTSQDPLGLGPAPNPAGYVPNPLAAADPLGLTRVRTAKNCPVAAAAKAKRPPKRPGNVGPSALKRPAPKRRPDPGIGKGRTQKQGGGTSQSAHYNKNSNYQQSGNSPGRNELTDVNNLINPGKTGRTPSPELLAYLKQNGVSNTWIKGHMLNDNLGGPGKSHNLTPFTSKANSAHKNHVESSLKELVGRTQGGAFKQNGLDGIGVDYKIKVSDEVRFPNSPNAHERSIRKYVEFDVKYTGVTPDMVAKMDRQGMNPLAELPPPGTQMDTITGKLRAPDGNGGWVDWKKGSKGHDFSKYPSL
ncbi:DUF6531 domain-containing protein [Amycolatopsis nigrescens]|uniref:DUF6531 domain-containing protein n=1 Tax=Amycolatopsis nigrescens TaxID=381445 RepID=UPI00059032F7|nr:DUF6531 domain-containing protein [Amycolatopsis nigrescens]